MIGDSDAEEMESSIVTNQDGMAYWTNFDHPIDFVTLFFWLGGITLIAIGMISAANAPDEEEAVDEAKDRMLLWKLSNPKTLPRKHLKNHLNESFRESSCGDITSDVDDALTPLGS